MRALSTNQSIVAERSVDQTINAIFTYKSESTERGGHLHNLLGRCARYNPTTVPLVLRQPYDKLQRRGTFTTVPIIRNSTYSSRRLQLFDVLVLFNVTLGVSVITTNAIVLYHNLPGMRIATVHGQTTKSAWS